MKKILFVLHSSSLGGPANSLQKLLKFLPDHLQAGVVAPGNGELFEILEQQGFITHSAGRYGLTWRTIPRLIRLINRENYDLVYGNNFCSGARNALIAAILTGRPFIWHIREMISSASMRTALFLRFAQKVVAVSQGAANRVYPFRRELPVEVVYNGVEFENNINSREFSRSELFQTDGINHEASMILSAGLVCERKGQEFIPKIASKLNKQGQTFIPAQFVCIGDLLAQPDYVKKVHNLIVSERVQEQVHMLGFRTPSNTYFSAADVFLHTAYKDPNPRVILEAMAAGLPVIAFDIDGVNELVVDEFSGYLIPLGDIEMLATKLRMLLKDGHLRNTLGRQGRKLVKEKFTSELTAKKIFSLVDETFSET